MRSSTPETTGQVMQFRVVKRMGADKSTPPGELVLPVRTPLPPYDSVRYLSLNEESSATVCVKTVSVKEEEEYLIPIEEVPCGSAGEEGGVEWFASPFGPTAALLGTYDPMSDAVAPLFWSDEITERPGVGQTEIWEIWNFTADAHPIHVHLVQLEVLGREWQDGGTSVVGTNYPLPSKTGTKDTVIVYPGEIARVKAQFNVPGFYVWHCHILEHEDNGMMRPYCVDDGNGSCPPPPLVP